MKAGWGLPGHTIAASVAVTQAGDTCTLEVAFGPCSPGPILPPPHTARLVLHLPFPDSVLLGKSLPVSEPQFPLP